MQRRKFLIGMGSLAAGSAAAMGTGAFTTMSAERTANINVVNDANGLIALKENTPSDVIRKENGELIIDLSADQSGVGVNVNSQYQIGGIRANFAPDEYNDLNPDGGYPHGASATPSSGSGAFFVVNQDTVTKDVTLTYTAEETPGGSLLLFQGNTQTEVNYGHIAVGDSDDDVDGTFTLPLDPGDRIGVSLYIDTRGGSVEDDLSGKLTVSANTPRSDRV